jgi:hypothetical protein
MSFPALGWASMARVTRASDKLVLLALADRHNSEHDLAYPSLAWLCDFSSLDRKTVVASLDRLEREGFIADSGVRVGKTKQIKAYKLNFNSAEKGTVKTEPLDGNSTVISAEQSQKRNTDTVLNQKQAKACYIKGSNLPDGLPAEPFMALVRARKALPKIHFTEDAARGIARKTLKLVGEGYDAAKLLWMAVDQGWRTVYPHDECKALVSVNSNRPLTDDELQSAIRFRRDIGDEEKVRELEAELSKRRAA